MCGMQLDAQRRNISDNGGCFYDLNADPYEMTNLLGTDAVPEAAGHMQDRLRAWHNDTPISAAPGLSRAC